MIVAFLQELDWSPLLISLKVAVIATIVCFFAGVFLAYLVQNTRSAFSMLLDGLLTLPLVLPPTVAGFILLYTFSPKRGLGQLLSQTLGIWVVQTQLGCVLAAVVIALPLMYRNAKAAFELVDYNLILVSRTLGMSEGKIFCRIMLPLAKPGLLSGMILTFARALGEYGATSMLAGNIPGKTGTVSQRIAMVLQNGDYQVAITWTAILLVIAFVCIVLLNCFSGKGAGRRSKAKALQGHGQLK